ncbi:MAG: CPBP family intramembrane metalloprotease [Thermococcus sp.]|uniref:CPBP family intramembrane glutamic endopeptidase n=1 Tax=Thermococcus sp. TaxID=35749 RepID=UPI001D9299C9|nr:type II CAAX endopeptidase family protein [Thermococcus sp.]MBO8175679.1 CPBP family intramembrane metalloprotease [Thermococcus sp.]
MLIPLFIALVLWLLVLIPSFIIAGEVSKKKDDPFIIGVVTQVSFFLLSVAVISLIGNLDEYGFRFSLMYVPKAFFVGLLLSAITAPIAYKLVQNYRPDFLPDSAIKMVLLMLILAPLGEETLYRGLIEGYLLCYTNLWVAIVFTAIIFGLVHILAFRDAPKGFRIFIVLDAVLMGLVAGYFRAISGSLIPAYALHSAANLVGMTGWLWLERKSRIL